MFAVRPMSTKYDVKIMRPQSQTAVRIPEFADLLLLQVGVREVYAQVKYVVGTTMYVYEWSDRRGEWVLEPLARDVSQIVRFLDRAEYTA